MEHVTDAWNGAWALTSVNWSAIGTWVTAMVAIAAAFFALRQVREARQLREEQAQPNVVLFAEVNATHWNYVDLVVRNFGATPAYRVKLIITPDPVVAPYENATTKEQITAVNYPREIPFLAPGQEWRTLWDSAERRAKYKEIPWNPLRSRFDAAVEYRDSRNKVLHSASVLDWAGFDSTMRLTKTNKTDKSLKEVARELAYIKRSLQRFGNSQYGLVTFDGGDFSDERARRLDELAQESAENDNLAARFGLGKQRSAGKDSPLTRPATEAETATGRLRLARRLPLRKAMRVARLWRRRLNAHHSQRRG